MKNKILIIGSNELASIMIRLFSSNNNVIDMYSTNITQLENYLNGKDYYNQHIKPINKIYNNFNDTLLNTYDLIILCVPNKFVENILLEINNKIKYHTIILNTTNYLFNTNYQKIFDKQNISYTELVGLIDYYELLNNNYTIGNCICNDYQVYLKIKSLINYEKFKLLWFDNIKLAELFIEIKTIVAIGMGVVNQLTTAKTTISSIFAIIINEILKLLHIFNINDIYLYNYLSISNIYFSSIYNRSENFIYGYNIIDNDIEFDHIINKYKPIFLNNEYKFIFFKYLSLLLDKKLDETIFLNLIFQEVEND